MRNRIKTVSLMLVTILAVGCGTSSEDKKSDSSIENLLSTGVLTGTTTSIKDNKNTAVKISKSNGVYSVEYPSLSCKGTLELISTSATEMIFKINFTEGSCLSGTKLKLTDVGNNKVAISEYAPDTVATTSSYDNAGTNGRVQYNSFALNDGKFTQYRESVGIVDVSNSGKTIIVDYPNRHCNAKWISIKSPSLNAIRFREKITYGTCTGNYVVEIRKNSSYPKRLDVTYFKPDGVTVYDNYYLYYQNDQASSATHSASSQSYVYDDYTTTTQQTDTQENYISTNTQTNTYITPGNTGFIKTYLGGGRFKISNGTLSRYSADGEYEATIRNGINSIVPLPKGKVLVLTTDGDVEVINYLDYPFSTLSSTSTNLTSIAGGTYSNGTVYVGSESFDVSRFTK